MTAENQTSDFKTYLEQLGYSKSSCFMLPHCVQDFLDYHKGGEEFTTTHIEEYYEWLQIRPHKQKEGGLSEHYINHHIYALRLYFNWQEQTGQLSYNPISVMRFRQPKGKPREPFTLQEILQLFAVAQSAKETAILHIFYSCGLRRSEGEALNRNDIHFKQRILYVRRGKGAKRRAVPMTAKVSAALEHYWQSERQGKAKDSEAFIVNRVGQRMKGDGYGRVLKELIERAGITREASLHHLRHSIATHLLESGLSIEEVRDFLGHACLETTQVYAKVNQKQLLEL